MPRKIVTFTMLMLLLVAPNLNASKVFLNGVDITDVKGKTFNKVKSIQIDEKGDIHIDAPQYEVKVLETGGGKGQTAAGEGNAAGLTQKYYLASQGPAPKVQYELTVVINGIQRVVIPASKSSVIREMTGWLNKGKNIIQVTAKKKPGPEGRVSTSKNDEVSLLIGAGNEQGKVVKINSLMATFKCNASMTDTITREYTIIAQ